MEHLLIEFYAYRGLRWWDDAEEVQTDDSPVVIMVRPSQIVMIEEWILAQYYRLVLANGEIYFIEAEWYNKLVDILHVVTIQCDGWNRRKREEFWQAEEEKRESMEKLMKLTTKKEE